ncbi:hypothetical protein [Spirosoma sordidisoli]|uniref:Uncharacterized protein n=1 Tax=Spirosoma sordidisoli TaxID=2502893 RepID=A0A4Q2UK74_9BACT|nr:hypothetical protein [Spirosoma sordidisoli]RYC69596.1 hypothetical protein EQG79_13415 [Spirosoma sordidisoli]
MLNKPTQKPAGFQPPKANTTAFEPSASMPNTPAGNALLKLFLLASESDDFGSISKQERLELSKLIRKTALADSAHRTELDRTSKATPQSVPLRRPGHEIRYTMREYLEMVGKHDWLDKVKELGKIATGRTKVAGDYKLMYVEDATWGKLGLYPEPVLDEMYNQILTKPKP